MESNEIIEEFERSFIKKVPRDQAIHKLLNKNNGICARREQIWQLKIIGGTIVQEEIDGNSLAAGLIITIEIQAEKLNIKNVLLNL